MRAALANTGQCPSIVGTWDWQRKIVQAIMLADKQPIWGDMSAASLPLPAALLSLASGGIHM